MEEGLKIRMMKEIKKQMVTGMSEPKIGLRVWELVFQRQHTLRSAVCRTRVAGDWASRSKSRRPMLLVKWGSTKMPLTSFWKCKQSWVSTQDNLWEDIYPEESRTQGHITCK